MKFYVGQEVVCIKTHRKKTVKEGEVYTIKNINSGCCMARLDVGLKTNCCELLCRRCNAVFNPNGIAWIGETLFAPLDSLTDISEIEEVLRLPAFEIIK